MTRAPDPERTRALLTELRHRQAGDRIHRYYPETGPLRREAYPQHMKFFAAGAHYRERCMMAANRVGKTEGVGLYELVLHLTGEYPAWWEGLRFDRPIRAIAAGDSMKTVRDILQMKLLGPFGAWGEGLIPQRALGRVTKAGGLPDLVDRLSVKHRAGGESLLTLKSYEQGRKSFQGTEIDVILLDEEPPQGIYSECLMRTMTTGGKILLTFTPLEGLSEVVLQFLQVDAPDEARPERHGRLLVQATWDDAPHLSEHDKQELWDSLPPYQRDARSKGIPMLGSGAIYPIAEEDVLVDDFEIPEHWPKAFALDVGWNRTAAVWGAIDRETGVTYLYSEYYRGQAEPVIHAEAIKLRGAWIPGAIDPAARGRSQVDGQQLLVLYRGYELDLTEANNAREAGIYQVWMALSTGKLKVMRSLKNWLTEYRLYRRDEQGQVVKERDHLMDGTRYLIMTGLGLARTAPPPRLKNKPRRYHGEGYWLG